jgi:transposase
MRATLASPRPQKFRSFKHNLDSIPFSNFDRPAKLSGANLRVVGRAYRLWLSRPIPEKGKPKSWEMSTDARGRWYVDIQVEVPDGERRNGPTMGIDHGLKDLAALSNGDKMNGDKIEMPAFYRRSDAKLAVLQRLVRRHGLAPSPLRWPISEDISST